MSGDFQYKPKFTDIRVRPPKPEEEAAARDVNSLKPGQVKCDWPGCSTAGASKAPKSREMLNEHYWFCQKHAAEYNKSWNFFAGLSEAEVRKRQTDEAVTGGRPTWSFKASNTSREAQAMAARANNINDPFGIFCAAERKARARAETAHARKLGKLEMMALADLDLDVDAAKPAIRARYKELLKRLHPDANGGDRSTEAKLSKVIKAYKALQAAGLA
ncbi:J domain-containing protein [soil metagenome]